MGTKKAKIQIVRGLKNSLPNLLQGELGYATDSNELFIGDPEDGNVLINTNKNPYDDSIIKNNITDIEEALVEVNSQLETKANLEEVRDSFVPRNGAKKPFVIFMCDDGSKNDNTVIKPLFDSKGIKGCLNLITEIVQSGTGVTIEDAINYQEEGWDICDHSINNDDLTLKSEEEIRQYIKESYTFLKSNGLNVNSFVYPGGNNNPTVRNIVREFYKCGCGVGKKVNDTPLQSFNLGRVKIETDTLDYYKSFVNELNNVGDGILIFFVHSAMINETQLSYLSELIDYIKSLSIEITTLSNALNYCGNKIDVGDFRGTLNTEEDYLIVDGLGNVYSKSLAFKFIENKGINNDTPITNFELLKATATGFLISDNANFPTTAGTLITYRFHRTSNNIGFQEWKDYATAKTYKRVWKSNNTWDVWKRTDIQRAETFYQDNVDFGIINANSTKELTFTVDGADWQDNVIANPYVTLDSGLIWNAIVKSVNTVTIRIANVTTNSITVTPRRWRILVVKN